MAAFSNYPAEAPRQKFIFLQLHEMLERPT